MRIELGCQGDACRSRLGHIKRMPMDPPRTRWPWLVDGGVAIVGVMLATRDLDRVSLAASPCDTVERVGRVELDPPGRGWIERELGRGVRGPRGPDRADRIQYSNRSRARERTATLSVRRATRHG